MSPWSHAPYVRVTLALASGVLVGRYCPGFEELSAAALGFLLSVYVLLVAFVTPVRFYAWRSWLGSVGLLCIALLGYMRYWAVQPHNHPDHLTQWAAAVEAYEAVALEDLHQRDRHSHVVVAVTRARIRGVWQQVQGKVQVSLSEGTSRQVHYGDVLLICGQPRAMGPPHNPHVFDYAAFLRLSQIYHQHWVVGSRMAVLGRRPPNPLQDWSLRVSRHCRAWLHECIHTSAARAVVLALVLGHKDALSSEVRSAYSEAGTLHVLAVSGLHVGILYGIVGALLRLLRVAQYLSWASPLTSLMVLWLYAFVTGLSPSVLRATLMLTLVVLASLLHRRSSFYNSLSASACWLLYWHPHWLFTVGFQLSYLAVLGIVYLQPRIYRWWSFRLWALDQLWLWSSVSLAAQLATAPASLYYFHQFPTYFLLANWLVVPAASVILCLGLLVLATCFWPGVSRPLAWVLECIVWGMNAWVAHIQALPGSVVDGISPSIWMVMCLYGLLICWLLFWRLRRLRYLLLMGLVALGLCGHVVYAALIQHAQCKVVCYSIDQHQAVAFIQGSRSTLWTDDRLDMTTREYAHHIAPSHVAWGVTQVAHHRFTEASQRTGFPLRSWRGLKVAVFRGRCFVFVHKGSLPLHLPSTKLRADFLVVEDNAVTSLQPWLDRFDVGMLVIGASNTRQRTQRLKQAAAQQGICSHALLQEGALVVE